MSGFSRITACSYNLLHCPELTFRYGSTPEAERTVNPDSEYIRNLEASMQTFEQAVSYSPNQAFIGAVSPLELPPRPWSGKDAPPVKEVFRPEGPFGDILEEAAVLGLLKLADSFDLVLLEDGFAETAKNALQKLSALGNTDLSKLDSEVSIDRIEEETSQGALPLYYKKKLAGCVKAAHPDDLSLRAHVIFENLASKAGAAYSVLSLMTRNGIDPASIDYIIETSEEACGDANQRGGGNFAKAIGELAGLNNATGSDTRSFCAGPVHGILQAASLVKAGTFNRVIVAAGGTTAKLAMNSKKHIEKGFPVLEDAMGSYALLVESADSSGNSSGIIIRNDITGIHRIGSGSSPQHVIQNLVADPLSKLSMRFDEVDYYAPELHNPEITEAGGAGNVTLANLKMIAAMAVMKKQIERTDIDSFIEKHGSAGWAPTQGHIPSGIPALGWILKWFEEGRIRNAMIIGKGSLFLGRMTGLFDGVSILLERPESKSEIRNSAAEPAGEKSGEQGAASTSGRGSGKKTLRVGLTIPGSESGADELFRGARDAEAMMEGLEVVCFGDAGSDPDEAHRLMEKSLASGNIDSAVTFHYPFPLGTATVGLAKAPGSGRDIFIASTTGISDTDRSAALVRNAVAGIAAAKAWGIPEPTIGLLNLDGARRAMNELKQLASAGWNINIVRSARGDELLRGNDIIAGTADVIVCDTLSGNAFLKMLAGFSSGGMLEVEGSGYGPGLGGESPLINIISRASGAQVTAASIIYSAKMAEAGLLSIYRDEVKSAAQAGYGRVEKASGNEAGESASPEPVPVDAEIEGVDVLMLDEAVILLKREGIYCEAGMGCTGPVVMLSNNDLARAAELLRKNHILGEE